MTMPEDLVLVRHGQSEGNVAIQAAKNGDTSHYTDAFMTTPDHHWHITDEGVAQAKCVGDFLNATMRIDSHYVSPYIRTRETAAAMNLRGAQWRLNRSLRERDWGDIGSVPKSVFDDDPMLARNSLRRRIDPLYWTPPNGESIATVAENRVRNVLDTLHREASDKRVLAVTHGETMLAFRLILERMSDAEFVVTSEDKAETIKNCEVIHYTRRHPDPTMYGMNRALSWRRRSRPVLRDGEWVMDIGEWVQFSSALIPNNLLVDPSNHAYRA
jgi:broad specificity phosphatase PhoE